jgi:hypothetical protein
MYLEQFSNKNNTKVEVEIVSIKRLTKQPKFGEIYIPMLDLGEWVKEMKMKLENEEV